MGKSPGICSRVIKSAPLPTASIPTLGLAKASGGFMTNTFPAGPMGRNCLFESAGFLIKKNVGGPSGSQDDTNQPCSRNNRCGNESRPVDFWICPPGPSVYKRADLLFSDLERLKAIGTGKIQIIYAQEKPHPNDLPGKALIERIFTFKETLKDAIKMVYLPNYDMELALKMVSQGGCSWIPLLRPGRLRHPRDESGP